MGPGPELRLSVQLKLDRADFRLYNTEWARTGGRNPFFRLIVRRCKK